MAKYFLGILFAALVVVPAGAAPTVRTMYVDATAKEQAVRAALADQATSEAVLKAIRSVVADYVSLVRHYPASSYSDNALWQAGCLSLDAFVRFGQASDQDAGVRLLQALAREYPASRLAKQVPERLSDKAVRTAPIPRPTAVVMTRPVETAAVRKVATIANIRRAVLRDVVRVTIELDAEVQFHDERISGPARIFVDFLSTRAAVPLVDQTIRFDKDADVVRQVRIGRHPNATTRVVLDATGVSSYSVYPLYSPYRLVIDCVRSLSESATPSLSAGFSFAAKPIVRQETALPPLTSLHAAGFWSALPVVAPLSTAVLAEAYAAPLPSRRPANNWSRALPPVAPMATAALRDAYTKSLIGRTPAINWDVGLPLVAPSTRITTSDLPPVVASVPSIPPGPSGADGPPANLPTPLVAVTPKVAGLAPNLRGGFSISRQLGLGVSRIVIDPGHGGHDPGAQSKGVSEAELVLDVALRLEKLLEDTHNFEVILTRRTDEFVPLPERTAVANREGADLFLSIHVNASPNVQARGVETYFLNFASNLSAAAVAARENAGSGQAMGALPDFVKAIALNNKLDESRDFATLVQHSMLEQLRGPNKMVKNLGVKQAPFVVLIGASMPSVLAEISFLTNTQEAKLLKSGAYRQRVAEALSEAITKYQTSLGGAQAVAHQQ